MQLTETQLQELTEQITQRIREEMRNEKIKSLSPVREAMHKVKQKYHKNIQQLANCYTWDFIQRTACLLNGYSQQRWVQKADAEKVAKTAEEICQNIIRAFGGETNG